MARVGPARQGGARADAALKVAILTPYFFPEYGGTQRVVEILAREFSAIGHEVRILTLAPTPHDPQRARERGDIPEEISVVRNARHSDVRAAMRWADVGLILYVTLRLGLPAILSGKPCVVAHHYWLFTDHKLTGAPVRLLRRLMLEGALSIACSQAVAKSLPVPARVAVNGYRDDLWRAPAQEGPRPIDILFVGRLVPEKGVDVLLAAAAELKRRGKPARLALIGAEDEGVSLARMIEEAGLSDWATHLGPLPAAAVAQAQSEAKIVAVPSRNEPFGLAALEGMAMGAVIVASNAGGLPEAVGEAGLLVPARDAIAWADAFESLLSDPARREALRAAAPAHLARFTARRMAEGYIEALREAVARKTHAARA
ncbi:MAG: glycosyltransferase family 4 protein [Hyphomonadaceae bacterium]